MTAAISIGAFLLLEPLLRTGCVNHGVSDVASSKSEAVLSPSPGLAACPEALGAGDSLGWGRKREGTDIAKGHEMGSGSLSWGRGFPQQQKIRTLPVQVWVPHSTPISLTITTNGDISLLLPCRGGRGKATSPRKAAPQSRVRAG